jgi:hypothetical protein
VNTAIVIDYDSKFELDKIKEEKKDRSNDYSFVVKKLIDFYKRKKEIAYEEIKAHKLL